MLLLSIHSPRILIRHCRGAVHCIPSDQRAKVETFTETWIHLSQTSEHDMQSPFLAHLFHLTATLFLLPMPGDPCFKKELDEKDVLPAPFWWMLLHAASSCCMPHVFHLNHGAKYSWGKLRQAEAVTVLVLVKKKHDPNMGKRLHAHGNFPQRNFKSWLSHASLAQRLRWLRPPSQPGSGCHLFASMEQAFHAATANDSCQHNSCSVHTVSTTPEGATCQQDLLCLRLYAPSYRRSCKALSNSK